MKPMHLNLAGMKKVKEDEHSASFMHPKGHTITIAKGKLPAMHKKQIEALPLCNGGAVKMAEGGEPPQLVPNFGNQDPNTTLAPQDESLSAQFGRGVGQYLLRPAIQGVQDLGTAAADLAGGIGQGIGSFGNSVAQGAGMGPAPVPGQVGNQQPSAAPGGVDQNQPANVPLGPPPQQMQFPGMGQGYNPYQGYNTQIGGIQNEAKAIGALEADKAKIYEHNQNTLKNIHENFQQNYLANQAETSDMIDDMKASHIDPNAYINHMTTGQHVGTAIGLLLGGMGGGVLGTGGNVAMDFLNKQIDRDVEAQKANIANKNTVFNAMQHQYGNQVDATKMTQAFYLAKTANEINIAAAKAGTPLAAARAQQMIGPLQTQIQQIHMQVAMRQAAFNALKNGGSAAAAIPYLVHDPAKAEDAAKAYGSLEQLNAQEKNVTDSFNHIRGQFMNGVLAPNDTASAKQAFIGNLQVALEHRYNSDAAAALGNALFPSKTDADSTVKNKLQRLHDEFDGSRREHQAVLSALTGGLMQGPAAPPRANLRVQKK